ncbi:MAG: SDR family oxidoreductase [Polyangiales bacterium]
MELLGQKVLITGASRGLGRSLALSLSRRGARLALVARDRAPLEEVAATIRSHGREAHVIAADVADKDAVAVIAGRALAALGGLDAVVHNASTLGPVPLVPLLDTACEDLKRALMVNLVGPHRLTKALAGPMLLQGRGLIVLVSSDAAVEAYSTWGAYGASKAALDHYGRILAAELDGSGVRVVTVDPGEMHTRMHADAIPDADVATLASPDDVAERLASLFTVEGVRTGSRVSASSLGVAP